MDKKKKNPKLLIDQPTDIDYLDFEAYKNALIEIITSKQTPLTIGIFGEWGTGKTSLMQMVQDYLDQNDVITVWFNAWRFEKEEHPIVPLIATIIQELEENKGKLSKLIDSGKSIIDALRSVAYGFATKAKVQIPGFAEIEASFHVSYSVR